ncbi:hypothetical protein CF326_g3981 [Tilletia indica]|nr:hypothetical protein CF326_g3981 [Tilletia indica]
MRARHQHQQQAQINPSLARRASSPAPSRPPALRCALGRLLASGCASHPSGYLAGTSDLDGSRLLGGWEVVGNRGWGRSAGCDSYVQSYAGPRRRGNRLPLSQVSPSGFKQFISSFFLPAVGLSSSLAQLTARLCASRAGFREGDSGEIEKNKSTDFRVTYFQNTARR